MDSTAQYFRFLIYSAGFYDVEKRLFLRDAFMHSLLEGALRQLTSQE